MTDAGLLTLLAIAGAVLLDLAAMRWLRALLRRKGSAGGAAGPEVRVLGRVSPLLTWLRHGRMPGLAPAAGQAQNAGPPRAATGSAHGGEAPAGLNVPAEAAAEGGPGSGALNRRAEPRSTPGVAWAEAEAAGLALAVALLILASAQFALLNNWETYLTPGLLGYAAGAGLFIWCGRAFGRQTAEAPFAAAPAPSRRPRLALWVTAAVLALYPALMVNREQTALQDRLLAVFWLASVGVFAWSALRAAHWSPPGRQALLAWWQAHRREAAAVAVIGLLALAARTYALELHPYAFANDEGEVGSMALEILRGDLPNWFEAGWSGQPIWSFVPTAVSVLLFDNTAFAARLVSAVQGALAAVFIYLLGREAFDRPTGLLAGGLLATLPWHIHFSRLGVNNVIDSFFSSGVLWLTYRALRRGRMQDYLWAGLAAGLTLYSYLGSRLVLALAVGTLGYAALSQRGYLRAHARRLLLFGAAAFVVALPQAVYFWRHADLFMGRLNSEGILHNGWLQRAPAETGLSTLGLLREQFLDSTLIFVARDGPAHFFNTPRPYWPWLAAIFLVLGLAWATWRLREARYMMLLAWFWAVVILGSTLTLGPPSHQRLIMAAPVSALLVAVGLRQAARLAEHLGLLSARAGLALAAGAALLTGGQGLAFYFGDYRSGHYYEDASNELAYEATRFATEELGADYRLFLLGHPSVYSGFANFSYLAPDLDTTDFNTISPAALRELPRDRGAFFVAVPSRQSDLEWVAKRVPGGRWIEVPRRYQGPETVYYAYLVPPEQFAAGARAGP